MRIGDYRIERELRSEATGMVVQATHVVLPRRVAIKVMHSDPGTVRGLAVQMLREACILESLVHPGVPRIYECGVLPDKRPWFAYQHIVGPTVTRKLDDGPFPAVEIVSLLRDVSDILVKLHALGVMHGRISEEALVHGGTGRYHLLDWSDTTVLDSEIRDVGAEDDILALGRVVLRALAGDLKQPNTDRDGCAPHELLALAGEMLGPEKLRPTAKQVHERALEIEVPSMIRERRWTPTCGSAPLDASFMIQVSRTRT